MMPCHTHYRFIALALALALAGCGTHRAKPADAPPAYIIYSPNGEPLNGGALGRPTCPMALSGWFTRLGAAYNDRIPREVFLSDAQAQFQRMDIDHNGYILSAELERFRAPYRQEPSYPLPGEPKDGTSQEGNKHRHKETSGNGHNDSQGDKVLLDPVMSADTNLDFKVTPEEFMQQAGRVFGRLDLNHDGFLDRAEVMTLCPPKP